MRLLVMAVRDAKAQTFGSPFYSVATGKAMRDFTDEVNRAAQDNDLYKHPDDFDLYSLGAFDNATGKFEVVEPQVLCRGKEVAIR